jgi:hypothetical protein
MYTNDAYLIHALMPEEDGLVDDSRWRDAHARVEYHMIVLAQLMEPEAARLAKDLINYYCIYRDADGAQAQVWLTLPPPSRAKIKDDHFRGSSAMQAYLEMAPTLGQAPDVDLIDRIVGDMIDNASQKGGPIIREGNTMLSGAAGPHLSGTPTERLVWALLYYTDADRMKQSAAEETLWERTEWPVEGLYRSVPWLHERIGGSLSTLHDAVRGLVKRRIVEEFPTKKGIVIRLRLPYTRQAADDRCEYSALRDLGFLPLTKDFRWPCETKVGK